MGERTGHIAIGDGGKSGMQRGVERRAAMSRVANGGPMRVDAVQEIVDLR
jgi:hypothetical protein